MEGESLAASYRLLGFTPAHEMVPSAGVTWYTHIGGAVWRRTFAAGDEMTQSQYGQDASVGSSTAGPSSAYSDLQHFFLKRLAWLHKQRRECVNVLNPADWRIRLINKALYSTYRDCVDAGVEDSAKQVLSKDQPSN